MSTSQTDTTKELEVFENQVRTADELMVELDKGHHTCIIVGQTQSGKTGTMGAIMNIPRIRDNYTIVVITGLSSTDWVKQTKERLNATERTKNIKILHRPQLDEFVDLVKGKNDVFIIMDEIQVASMKNQSIYKCFNELGYLESQTLHDKNIRIVEFTATPDGSIYDIDCVILAQPGDGYTSSRQLLEDDKIRPYGDLCGFKFDNETKEVYKDPSTNSIVDKNVKQLVDAINSFDEPRYHIIRTQCGKKQQPTIDNILNQTTKNQLDCNYIKFDKSNKDINITDINDILIVKPTKHTLIFIKELLRCAKTIHKEFIGVCYERFTNKPDDATIIQGLLGRLNGYDYNGESICFTNIDSIKRYYQLWDSGWEDKDIKWSSKTTKKTKDGLTSKQTFNSEPIEEDVEEQQEPPRKAPAKPKAKAPAKPKAKAK